MIEDDYKKQVSDGLAFHGWKVQEHEDKHSNFIPDLSFGNAGIDGWIELKWQEKPPSSLDSIDHWTKGQEQWLIDRGRVGSGHCFLWVGTPKLHAIWRYGTLSSVRHVPWESAVQCAWMKDYTLAGVLEQMNAKVRRRVTA